MKERAKGLINNKRSKDILAWRRQERNLKKLGYNRHEADWEIHRGSLYGKIILDVKISLCGKYIWTLLGDRK